MLQIVHQMLFGFRIPKTNSDWITDKLVYRGLVNLQVLFALTACYLMLYQKSIDCIANEERVNSFCWNTDMFLYIPADRYEKIIYQYQRKYSHVGVAGTQDLYEEVYPGIRAATVPESKRFYLFEVRWVAGFFLLLAFLSMIPRGLWLFLQKRILVNVMRDLNKKNLPQETMDKQLIESGERFVFNMRAHNCITWRYCFVQFFYVLALGGEYGLITWVYGKWDWFYGYNIISHHFVTYGNWSFDLVKTLPRVAICEYKQFGPGGTVEEFNTLCSLNSNHTYQLMLAISWVLIVVLFCIICVAYCEGWLFLFSKKWRQYKLGHTLGLHPKSQAMEVIKRLDHGSCFLILLLEKNLDIDIVCKILSKVSDELELNSAEVESHLLGMM